MSQLASCNAPFGTHIYCREDPEYNIRLTQDGLQEWFCQASSQELNDSMAWMVPLRRCTRLRSIPGSRSCSRIPMQLLFRRRAGNGSRQQVGELHVLAKINPASRPLQTVGPYKANQLATETELQKLLSIDRNIWSESRRKPSTAPGPW